MMRSLADFVNFLPPLPLPAEMRAWDAAAVRLGLPEVLLMENAASAAFETLRAHRPHLAGQRVWLFMGSGNNGGDAACLARHLLDAGARPLVLHTKALGAYKGVTARHLRIARAAGVAFAPLARHHWQEPPDILVDGLLGTGFTGELRPDLRTIIERINQLATSRFVLALDIPSGLNGISGQPSPVAVRATATVSFAAAKPGLVLPWARPWTGRLHVRPIGIPAAVRAASPCGAYLLDGHCLRALPGPPENSYKNSFGHLLVLGGAPGLGGAAHLAARAALRAGAGLVTAAAPAAALPDIKSHWPEIMTLALTASDAGRWPDIPAEELQKLCSRHTALVVGPGMGRDEDAARFLAALLKLPQRPPAIFDADALMLLARRPALLEQLTARDILTPHPGEAAALLACATGEIQAARPAALTRLCARCPSVVVLKGAGTLVGQSGMPLLISPYDVPQLAVGGSGDVLAGCLGGLLARGDIAEWPGMSVAGLGVALHALAGRFCAATWPERGNRASELADALPMIRAKLINDTTDQAPQETLPWPE
ncbi:NAD(P)H-hydrate dehydratase [uncultured Desulfovibrio sp.]|uniref:NAD(P)H-hydrate dehydratase n=1 Tax=uncultured Desulfovibrio sp. TaxID=167968 RepID=UPI002616CEC7|nr:NAD(P)H-hydrate dehydratase [uncultured Desulfovibrio sp.]